MEHFFGSKFSKKIERSEKLGRIRYCSVREGLSARLRTIEVDTVLCFVFRVLFFVFRFSFFVFRVLEDTIPNSHKRKKPFATEVTKDRILCWHRLTLPEHQLQYHQRWWA
jgi:hypothetical protein